MLINFKVCLVGVVLIGCASSALSSEGDHNAFSPVSGLEPGKLTVVSINELPAALKVVSVEDLKRDVKNKSAVDGRMDYEKISDEAVLYATSYQNRLRTLQDVSANAKSKLADIGASQLNAYRFEGVVPQGPSLRGPWSSFDRVFRRPDGVLIILHEWDFIADGGGVMAVKELMNLKVQGLPARFVVKKSPSGKKVSELTWVSSKKYYTIAVWDEIGSSPQQAYNLAWLMALAEPIK
ncbi:hypothetical protein JD974_22720 [Chromobacterium haemolyticum]|uniref:Lipoprotein n=1 Tax=Chromobacterium haemolyticum TaxID=394935 RepID=A0ABS3GTG7_9NEIS|nr:hypothetical protein [Chromobacterium haemolyticum]MBK0417228.1 hypothetical protein [Chromobacterium haemolyticum]MBO0418353.1 hypothetical protein [Chromobacterium haemolyticum]MBO0501678.1 hypothetical protein [Chromobacterium haemolyticum]